MKNLIYITYKMPKLLDSLKLILFNKILIKSGIRESYTDRRLYVEAIKRIDKDAFLQLRNFHVKYWLELHGRLPHDEYFNKQLNEEFRAPSIQIKQRHKKGDLHFMNFTIMAYISVIKHERENRTKNSTKSS